MFKYWPKISAAIDRDRAEKGVHIEVHCFYAINLNEKGGVRVDFLNISE
jgi:hypothetical protein